MDETPRSSFIPKQGAGMIPTTVRKRKRFYVFGFVGTVCLVGTLLLAVGAYFYKGSMISKLESEKRALAQEKDKFSEEQILEVRQFERKLKAALYLLENHIAPSKILNALHVSTLAPVQLVSFSMEQRPSQNVGITVEGGTEAFRVVALQEFALADNALLKNAIISDLAPGDSVSADSEKGVGAEGDEGIADHRIGFSVVGDVNASLLAFDGESSALPVVGSIPASSNDLKTEN